VIRIGPKDGWVLESKGKGAPMLDRKRSVESGSSEAKEDFTFLVYLFCCQSL
jgi:hypothetical protein